MCTCNSIHFRFSGRWESIDVFETENVSVQGGALTPNRWIYAECPTILHIGVRYFLTHSSKKMCFQTGNEYIYMHMHVPILYISRPCIGTVCPDNSSPYIRTEIAVIISFQGWYLSLSDTILIYETGRIIDFSTFHWYIQSRLDEDTCQVTRRFLWIVNVVYHCRYWVFTWHICRDLIKFSVNKNAI